MSDPFANYDAWLEEPYQEMYAKAERAEWIEENSTYETDCCGIEVSYADVQFTDGEPSSVRCAECGEVAGLDVTPPDEGSDDYDDSRDDWDDAIDGPEADEYADRYFNR
jgi:hypothetical protein